MQTEKSPTLGPTLRAVPLVASMFKEYIQKLHFLLDCLREAGLKVSLKNCHLLKEVEFLGYLVSDKDISMDAKKVEAIRSLLVPQSPKDMSSFLGLCSYYMCFI